MRSWLRKLLILSVGLVIVAAAGYSYIFHFGGLEQFVIGKINDALNQQTRLEVSIGRIRGNFIDGLILESVSLDFVDSTRAFTVVSVAEVSATYSLTDIWNKVFEFDKIRLVGVELNATRDKDGQWLMPLPGLGSGGKRSPISFAVAQFEIETARMRIDRTDDTLWINDLNLVASVQSQDQTFSLDIRKLSFSSSDSAIFLDNFSGKATLAEGQLFFQDVTLDRDDTHLKLSGAVDMSEWSGNVEFVIDGLDLADVRMLTGAKLKGKLDLTGVASFLDGAVRGRASIGGLLYFASFENLFIDFSFKDRLLTFDTLYGSVLGGCAIDGSGAIDFTNKPEQYQLSADLRNFDLKQIVRNSFTTDLSGRLELIGESFSKEGMLLELDVEMYESSFDQYPLHRAAGPIEITTRSVRFPTAFEVDYFENKFYTVGVIDYRGDMRLEVEADLANLDRYRGKLFIDQPGGRGKARATISGKTTDPDLSGWFSSDSLWIYGLYSDSCYSSFDIDRFLRDRDGWVEVDLLSGAAWQVPYDTGYAMVSIDSGIVLVDTLAFSSQFAHLSSKAELNQTVYPWLLTIDTLSLKILERDFYNKSKMVIEVDSLGFDFLNTVLGEEVKTISANKRLNFDETMDLALNASGIPLAPWLRLFEWEIDVDAILSGEAELAGAFASPVFSLTGSLDSLIFRDTALGDLSGSAHYRDGLVTIDSLVVLSDQGKYRVDGKFYADLSFGDNIIDRLPEQPLDLNITASDRQFNLVYLFLPSVEQLDGDFKADVQITGTPRKLLLDGQAYLKNGRLKYFDLVDTIKTDSASVRMKDKQILIDGIRTYVYDKKNNRRAYADISGALTVKALDALDSLYYDLKISIPEDLPFKYDLDDIEGVVKGDLRVVGETPPTVSGNLTVVSGKYQAEFADDETGSPLMLALAGENSWDLNINLEFPSNCWIKNEDVDAELSGFLNIIREDGRYRFIGSLDILRGRGYLFDKTFKIIPDSARVIFEDIEYPNPRLDIWATSRIPISRSGDKERSYQDLKVHVTGTLDNPEFSFFLPEEGGGDTPLSYEAIVPLIVANAYGGGSSGGAFEERISQLISSQVSQIGTRRFGVETFEVDPTYEGYLDLAQTRVTLGLYTSSNLYLWGRSDVAFGHRPEAGFEYRFSKALLLEGFRDENIDEGERYHLNFKLHWDFK